LLSLQIVAFGERSIMLINISFDCYKKYFMLIKWQKINEKML